MTLVDSTPLHERWSDQAVAVWLLQGQPERAKKVILLARGQPDRSGLLRCVAAFGRASVWRVLRGFSGNGSSGHVHPEDLSETDRAILGDGQSQLGPVVTAIEAGGGPKSGIEVEIVSIAATVAYLLNDAAGSRVCAGLLVSTEPVPLELARSVTRGHLDAPADLPGRLRNDYPRSFEALFLAALIQGEHLGDAAGAFQHAADLARIAQTVREREDWCELVRELAELAGGGALGAAGDVIVRTLGQEHRAYTRWRVEKLLRDDKLTEAEALLDQTRDDGDPVWLQYKAQLQLRLGRKDEAARNLVAASRLLPRPPLLRWAAAIAGSAGQWEGAAEALERLVNRQPKNVRALQDLAYACWQLRRYREAAERFRLLAELTPGDGTHALNRAIALVLDGQFEGSLQLVKAGAGIGVPTAEACLARAGLLASLDTPEAGFKELRRNRGRFWSEPEFISHYMSLAFASGHDDKGRQALERLVQMRHSGELIGDRHLKQATVDDLIELMKERAARAGGVAQLVLAGRCPWLLADATRQLAPYAGWQQRTRPGLAGDMPIEIAMSCVYSTNGFAVERDTGSGGRLVPFRCAPAGKRIVADLSALISLHRLGLLEAAAKFFGRIIVPADYVPSMLRQVGQLHNHRPSQVRSARAIAAAIAEKRLGLCPPTRLDTADGPLLLQEYGDPPDETSYCLIDVAEWLAGLGFISREEQERLRGQAVRRPDAGRAPLASVGDRFLCADLLTLKALALAGCLDGALRTGRLMLREDECTLVQHELREEDRREELLRWHHGLLKTLRTDDRFERPLIDLPRSTGRNTEDLEPADFHTVSALLLAKRDRLPLMVDDRWCQVQAAGVALEVEVLGDSAHPLRRPAPPGPYVFVDQPGPDPVHRAILPSLVLTVSDLAARRAAISELQRAIDRDASWLSMHARTAIRQQSGRLASARLDEWTLAAAAVAESLKEDFVWNVAGLLQSLEMGIEDGADQHWPGVAYPSAISMLWGPADGYSLMLTPEAAKEAVNRCADEAPTLAAALDRYELLFGHLPLVEPFTLGAVILRWQERRGAAPDPWEALLKWCDVENRPVRSYHVCRAVLGNKELMAGGRRGREFWRRLAKTLRAAVSMEDPPWQLRAEFAAHYSRYLQLVAPAAGGERLVCAALWAAEHGARALLARRSSDDPQGVAHPALTAAKALSEDSQRLWHFTAPPSAPSIAGFTVAGRISPWGAALLSSLGDALEWLPSDDADPTDLSAIAGVLQHYLVLGYGAATPDRYEVPWGFGASLATVADRLAVVLQDVATRENLEGAMTLYRVIADPTEVTAALRALPKFDEVRQLRCSALGLRAPPRGRVSSVPLNALHPARSGIEAE